MKRLTKAVALSSGVAVVLHTRLVLRGPFTQSGNEYTRGVVLGVMRILGLLARGAFVLVVIPIGVSQISGDFHSSLRCYKIVAGWRTLKTRDNETRVLSDEVFLKRTCEQA